MNFRFRCRRGREPRRGSEDGQALVETALIAPVLFAVLFAIIKVGIAFHNYIVLTDAVRTAARQLAISRGVATACSDAVVRVQTAAVNLNLPAAAITTSPSQASGCALTAGGDATVTATKPCDLTIMSFDFAFGQCVLTATATERVE